MNAVCDRGGCGRMLARGVARSVAVAVAVALVAFSLGGCGSGALSAPAMRAQASLVCTSAVRRSDRIAAPRSNAGGGTFLTQGIKVFRPELAALRKLTPPRALAGAYRAALADSAQQVDALIATDHYLHVGGDPVVAIRQLDVELSAINARDREAWRALGVPVCANLTTG